MEMRIILIITTTILFSCDKKESQNLAPDTIDLSSTFEEFEAEELSSDTIPHVILSKSLDTKAENDLKILTNETVPGCSLPTRIADLRSGVEIKLYKFDKNTKASASAMGFSGEIGKNQMVFIQDYIRYGFIECNGKKEKLGIGLRCFIHITEFKGKVGYNKLPGVAANVELGNAECSYDLRALGFAIEGSTLADGLNPQGEYNVENFGKLAATFNNVLRELNSTSEMKIDPVQLP